MANNKKRNTGLAVACCFLCALVLFIVFLVKKDIIINNLQATNFFGRVFGKNPEFVENHTSANENQNNDRIELDAEIPLIINVDADTTVEPKKNEQLQSNNDKTDQVVKTDLSENKKPTENKKTQEEKKPEQKPVVQPKPQQQYTELQLCFVEIDYDGSVNRKMIKRSVPKNDSPLTNSINLLIKGPDTSKSAEKNCMSLIPAGTKLLSAKVSDGIAYLNFNDAFEINTVGVEGYIGQLMQIVYTATTFSTVNSVQFLIEGKKKEYLGSEGQWIGSPLSRNSF